MRQAYDEFSRPARLVLQLALLPGMLALWFTAGVRPVMLVLAAIVILAEAGRCKNGGAGAFPPDVPFWAPLWVAERSMTIWCAVACRALAGGVRYGDARIAKAANSVEGIRRRCSAVGALR